MPRVGNTTRGTRLPGITGEVLSILELHPDFHVFPVKAGEKKPPLIPDFPNNATNNFGNIRAFWKDHPDANAALVTGIKSNVVVIDLDSQSAVEHLMGVFPEFKNTLSVITSRGRQFYFEYPAGHTIHNSAGKLGLSIDVRGEGGYVMLPPSRHPSGHRYRYANPDAPILQLPAVLLTAITSGTTLFGANGELLPTEQAPDKGVAIVPDSVMKGTRNDALTRLVGKAHGQGWPPDVTKAMAYQYNAAHVKPPLPTVELDRILASILRRKAGTSVLKEIVEPQPDLICLASIEAKPVSWLWRSYLAFGQLAMLTGDPGVGKTFIGLAVAAALTTGHVPYTGEVIEPVHVLNLSVENDASCQVRPRFDALGGDPRRLHLLRGVSCGEEHAGLRIDDINILAEAVRRTGARLIIIDPVQSYLNGVDYFKANEVRSVLDPLIRFAQGSGCAVLLIRHTTKGTASRAIYRGQGSQDFTASVRLEMLAGTLPDRSQNALIPIKSNLGQLGPALGFKIEPGTSNGLDVGKFFWTGETELTAADLLAPEDTADDKSKIDAARDFLLEELAEGPRLSKDIEKGAKRKDISWGTVRRAAKDLHVRSRQDGFHGKWVMELPNTQRSLEVDGEEI